MAKNTITTYGVFALLLLFTMTLISMMPTMPDASTQAPATGPNGYPLATAGPGQQQQQQQPLTSGGTRGTTGSPTPAPQPVAGQRPTPGHKGATFPPIPDSSTILPASRMIPGAHQAPKSPETAPSHLNSGNRFNRPDPSKRFDSAGKSLPADNTRANAVRDAMKHAWDGYAQYAWGMDELRPVSKGADNWLSQGITITDSLDTLYIMGLDKEFEAATEWVRTSLNFKRSIAVSVFETTIRSLGGLLSAWDLSGEEIFMIKAIELADLLLKAFDTPTGIPYTTLNLASGTGTIPSWTGGSAILSELGTIQLEFKYLSYHTGNPVYGQAAERAVQAAVKAGSKNGLYPLYINANRGAWTNNAVSLGAMGDSFYEYLLKQWLQTGKRDYMWWDLYQESAKGMMEELVKRSTPKGYTYIAEQKNGRAVDKMDHLACFVGGMFTMGAQGNADGEAQFTAGSEITRMCVDTYTSMPSGLSPEYWNFQPGKDFVPGARHYLLRPETSESVFYMWRLTGDPVWRDRGWAIFQGIERSCRTEVGYSGVRDVTSSNPAKDDKQQSFFLAETLKYLYLLFTDDTVIPLDNYVFNTEAHPLSNFDYKPGYWPSDNLPW